MKSKHTAIILGKLALLEYRVFKTALNQNKCPAKNGVILLKFELDVGLFSIAYNKLFWKEWDMESSGMYHQISILHNNLIIAL